ncbi:MAG: SecY-interacting protein Syd, partial [Rhodothermales bacterium]|nr:SecY-interacting protein Syd [Rhodothermales bacterium]
MSRYLDLCQRELASLPAQAFDPAWPSPCQVGEPDERGMILWRPVARDVAGDFSGWERALEVEVHPDIKDYYGS